MIPSRGSKEAMAAGCYCPIGTWTSPHCPVHDADDTYQCPNCIRLEADLEREQEAGLLRKAERDKLVEAATTLIDDIDAPCIFPIHQRPWAEAIALKELLKEIAE